MTAPPGSAAMATTPTPVAPAATPPPASGTAPASTPAPATSTVDPKRAEQKPASTAPAAPAPKAADKTAETARAEPPKTSVATRRETERRPARVETTEAARASETVRGDFWVQVGAFRDPDAAKRLAARLRERNFRVDDSGTTRASPATPEPASAPAPTPQPGAPSDRYDVVVSGAPNAEVAAKLEAKGLSVDTAPDGVRVKPSLPLRDAVAMSKDLATEGFKVQVRRAGAGAPAAAPAPTRRAITEGETLHRVRVGPFDDRASAVETVRKLEALGYKPFVARGPQ